MPDRTPFDDLDPELLDRYLAGECTEDERAQMRRWLMARPDAARRLSAFLGQVDDGGAREAMPDVTRSWQTLRANMRASDRSPSGEPGESSVQRGPRPQAAVRWAQIGWAHGIGIAAACVVLVGGVSYVASHV